MRLIFGIVLLAGLGLAGFAVHMAQGYVGSYQTALQNERAARANMVETTEVFVATRAIRYGEPLAPEDVALIPWPTNAVPVGAFQEASAVKVTDPGQDAGVSSRLSAGMRAFAIRVDVASGVSGFLRPGDRVDVYWTGRLNDGDVTKLIQTGVRIVAIDQSADEDRNAPSVARTVTVEADPQQVASLAQAQSTGRLSLALMGATDESVADAVQVDQRGLLGIRQERVVEAVPQKECTVRTRRGGEVVVQPIPCSN
jgi:pilus assembly protein CpaB